MASPARLSVPTPSPPVPCASSKIPSASATAVTWRWSAAETSAVRRPSARAARTISATSSFTGKAAGSMTVRSATAFLNAALPARSGPISESGASGEAEAMAKSASCSVSVRTKVPSMSTTRTGAPVDAIGAPVGASAIASSGVAVVSTVIPSSRAPSMIRSPKPHDIYPTAPRPMPRRRAGPL